jgi:hypothetical protein
MPEDTKTPVSANAAAKAKHQKDIDAIGLWQKAVAAPNPKYTYNSPVKKVEEPKKETK